MKKRLFLMAITLSMSASAASVDKSGAVVDFLPYRASASIGYTGISKLSPSSSGLLRVSVSKDMARFDSNVVGLELGGQTGYQSKLPLNAEQNLGLGGTAVEVSVNPFIDVLATVRHFFGSDTSTAGFVKAGVAYRQMHFDRDTLDNKSKVQPELQVGIEKQVNENVEMFIAYQGIFSRNLQLSLSGPMFEQRGTANTIPGQHGVLVGFNVAT